jgi:hypothetical protein
MTRVCSWCNCILGKASDAAGEMPTHGICPRCLLSVLEQLETIASDVDRLLPAATWLIVVGPDDPLLLRELQQRFSRSSLVCVIRDRRVGESPLDPSLAAPNERRSLGSAEQRDPSSYGFFVVHRPDPPLTPNGAAP